MEYLCTLIMMPELPSTKTDRKKQLNPPVPLRLSNYAAIRTLLQSVGNGEKG